MADQHVGRHRVVIIGGGFAGLFAARALRRSPVSVTLVDQAPNHVFQPLLYQCATGILSEGKIAFPLRSLLSKHKNVECQLAQVVDFDVSGRKVKAIRPNGEPLDLPYDDLIVAAGVQQSYFGHDEFAQFAPGMKTIADALAIRRRVFGAFEMAESPATTPSGGRGSRSRSSGPARSASSLPRRCAASTATSSRRTPGYCCSTAVRRPSPRSGRSYLAGPARR
jgi:NADH dehydrogenase